jgi:hypothetical protein
MADGMYYSTRTIARASEVLKKMVFPWVDESLRKLELFSRTDQSGRVTARAFLQLMLDGREIYLQDAAATFVLHPERMSHQLFSIMPVFKTVEFLVSFWLRNF